MKLLDTNLLIYATDQDSVHHAKIKPWFEKTLSGEEPVAFAWVVLLGFLRITTNPRVFPTPLTPEDATGIIDGWLAFPSVRVLSPGTEHWRILKDLLASSGTAGNLTTDAHLAALAIENGCELVSTDSDFARFARLRWVNPLAMPAE